MSDLIECPICSTFYDSSKINQHVNLCLIKDDKCLTRNELKAGRSAEKSTRPMVSSQNTDHLHDDGFWKQPPEEKASLSQAKNSENNFPKPIDSSCIGIRASKRSLSDVLGKRSLPNSKDFLSSDSRKKLKLSPTSASKSENIPNNVVSSPDAVQGAKDPENQKEHLKDLVKNLKTAKDRVSEIDLSKSIPLAEQLRPTCFEEFFGQNEVLGGKSSIRFLLQSSKIPSVILWGPPGCGKTSLVNIITALCKKGQHKRVVKLSATTSGINDVKEAVKVAKNELTLFKRETVLFIDEIHRFNKLQQDYFLPHVENGTITLIGATTENPSFHVNGALLSRCKVIVLKKHTIESIMKILERAVEKMGGNFDINENAKFTIEKNALEMLANLCDGDARYALNGLEMAVNASESSGSDAYITTQNINNVLQRTHVLYDKNGEEHYNIISALHKSIRGSDDNAALYWLARMLEGGEDPLYIARRLVRVASEDIGLADSSALTRATSAYQSCHFIGMPECDVILAHLVVYLARAPKSVEVYKAYHRAKSLVKNWKGPLPAVPLHLRNAPTRLMKELNYGKDYKYNPDYKEPVEQEYFPSQLIGTDFFPETVLL